MIDTSAGRLAIVEQDKWLEPVEDELLRRRELYISRLHEAERLGGSLAGFASAHRFFGFTREEHDRGWIFREWLPGAREVYIFGDFNGWQRSQLPLARDVGGVWSIFLSDGQFKLRHGSRYKIRVVGDNGDRDRIPAYARRTVQDGDSKDFAAQFWNPAPFNWQGDNFDASTIGRPVIYECHVGMSQEREGVGTYREFTRNVLPRIKKLGYNALQLMAVAEHPYYGSFGYHVSNFFAVSSRSGTPEELKYLIRKAHKYGIAVIMDIVHAHYVKNFNEGLNELDGTDSHYSPPGEEGCQRYWDSKLFDYSKPGVLSFLLSNLRYWTEEFHFDGFRFDGVTSMIYKHHGYTEFDSREKFFDDTVNRDALAYLTLANRLVHELRPSAITIAEDVSGMPGICSPIEAGGVGFDYRLGMAIPDFWIRLLKEVPDERWNIWEIWNIMTDRLPWVPTIAYAESHDQALVGDKTIAFRLMDKEMYTDMNRSYQNLVIDRGIALHKMIRLITISCGGQGYLNFMGNEFGHPEWIDFPRRDNGWSYRHARRQWSLADNPFLRYSQLQAFDAAMVRMVRKYSLLDEDYPYNLHMDEANKTMVYERGGLLFVFNWHPSASIPDYEFPVREPGRYRLLLSTDEARFGGCGRASRTTPHFTSPRTADDGTLRHFMRIYNTSRTAQVFIRY